METFSKRNCLENRKDRYRRVKVTSPDNTESNGELHATIDVGVRLCAIAGDGVAVLSPTAATLREDDGSQVTF